jgi:hypothetical protein
MPLLLLEGEKIFIPLGEKMMMSMKKILSIILIISILAISAPINAVNVVNNSTNYTNDTNFGNFMNYTFDGLNIQFYDNEASVRAGWEQIIASGEYCQIWNISGVPTVYRMNLTGDYKIESIYRQVFPEKIGIGPNKGVSWNVQINWREVNSFGTIINHAIGIGFYNGEGELA